MSHVIPPYPRLVLPKSRLLRHLMKPWLLAKSRHCPIAMITAGAYTLQAAEVRLPTQYSVFPLDPSDIRRVLVDESADFPKSGLVADTLELLLGDSIFVSNGEIWKRQRRMMEPAFALTRVRLVFDLMLEAARSMTERLDRQADGRSIDVEQEMTFVTADIIFRTIFSRPLQPEEARIIFPAFRTYQEAAYSQGIYRLLRLPKWLTWPGFRRARAAAAAIRSVLDPIVRARYDSFAAGRPQIHNDILQSLIVVKDEVSGTRFDFRELCEQVAMLFLAGHETSASALSWSLWLLSLDQGVQDRMHREVTDVLGPRELDFADLRKLNLTRNVFAETMRLFPPVPFLPRVATRTCILGDKKVHASDIVSISPWIIHRHRRHWHHPDAFDPDRFDRPETRDAERNCYIPFSKGPRVCLGASFALQEAAIILSTLVRRYRFEPLPGFRPELVGRLTVRSTNGIWLKLSRREPSPGGVPI